jgi:hypothetical protein
MPNRVAVIATLACLATSAAYASASRATAAHGAHMRHGWMARDANPHHPWLYVDGYNSNTVSIYDVGGVTPRKIGEITSGVSKPAGISLDRNGTLYVSSQAGNVQIYPAGATSPSLTLSQGLTYANDAVADSAGDVFVANSGGSAPSIVVYPPGQTTPSETIASSVLGRPYGESFDAQGNLYISDWDTGVCMIPKTSQTVTSLALKGGGQPAGIAFDDLDATLFVNYYYGNRTYKTLAYKSAPAPVRALRGNVGGNAITVGKIRNVTYVFIPDFYSDAVYVYQQRAKGVYGTIPTDVRGANGIAFKPAGIP